ncbi:hypothetical protein FGO68_gene14957 [Halteria grandinella]|uniref:Uncharacterized protein n=1 Tax=Halteria grandinella TaxID=5974 RepID=A0A8J8T1Z9_HALGN|nr:hypothetical protein FGO68_gene14957 [Halteria grandinella]
MDLGMKIFQKSTTIIQGKSTLLEGKDQEFMQPQNGGWMENMIKESEPKGVLLRCILIEQQVPQMEKRLRFQVFLNQLQRQDGSRKINSKIILLQQNGHHIMTDQQFQRFRNTLLMEREQAIMKIRSNFTRVKGLMGIGQAKVIAYLKRKIRLLRREGHSKKEN